jgi:membrane peptidoglycan carboxypeptidase
LVGSGPSLAAQLASSLLLKDEPASLRRSLREQILAVQITSRFGRQKVLEWYLNSASFGRLTYGADAAARAYFGKPAGELSLAEAAYLAATAQSPDLNPLDAPQAAQERQQAVIQKMLRYQLISPEQGIAAVREDPQVRDPKQQGRTLSLDELQPNLAPAFSRMVVDQLLSQFSQSELERGGLRIITSLDYDLQMQANCAAAAQVGRLQGSQETGPVSDNDCPAGQLLPALPEGSATLTNSLEANVILLQPQSGEILALVGQPPAGPESAPLPVHPPGTLATPWIYLTAFTRGFSPASLLWDIPLAGNQAAGESEARGPLRLRSALVNDILRPATSLAGQIGLENIWRTTQQLGITAPQQTALSENPDLSIFRDMQLVEIAQAYATLANQGVLAGRSLEPSFVPLLPAKTSPPTLHPSIIRRVERTNGDLLRDWSSPQTRPIITPQLAYLATHVLSDETARWPSLGHPNPLEIGRPAAAKIGRTPQNQSNWAVGYIPQMVAGVWLGLTNANESPAQQSMLPEAAAGLWHAVIQYAARDLPYETWAIPSGISTLEVCDPSGMLPTADCPNVVIEVFLAGSEPIQLDRMYRTLEINRENGRLATLFTPQDQIIERTFLLTPPEAANWAQNARLETPPGEYDAIPIDLPANENAQITSPDMFATLRGEIDLLGTASGEDFDFYRIQVGQGLRPQQWLQVGEVSTTPVENGKLAVWDSGSLNGLYAVQLLVVSQDQSVSRATVFITVDNLSPQVEIVYPVKDEKISLAESARLVFQARVQDNLEIKEVLFYVDDRLLGKLTQAPFAISWTPVAGSHTLRVVATDQAGNSAETTTPFTVK